MDRILVFEAGVELPVLAAPIARVARSGIYTFRYQRPEEVTWQGQVLNQLENLTYARDHDLTLPADDSYIEQTYDAIDIEAAYTYGFFNAGTNFRFWQASFNAIPGSAWPTLYGQAGSGENAIDILPTNKLSLEAFGAIGGFPEVIGFNQTTKKRVTGTGGNTTPTVDGVINTDFARNGDGTANFTRMGVKDLTGVLRFWQVYDTSETPYKVVSVDWLVKSMLVWDGETNIQNVSPLPPITADSVIFMQIERPTGEGALRGSVSG